MDGPEISAWVWGLLWKTCKSLIGLGGMVSWNGLVGISTWKLGKGKYLAPIVLSSNPHIVE